MKQCTLVIMHKKWCTAYSLRNFQRQQSGPRKGYHRVKEIMACNFVAGQFAHLCFAKDTYAQYYHYFIQLPPIYICYFKLAFLIVDLVIITLQQATLNIQATL